MIGGGWRQCQAQPEEPSQRDGSRASPSGRSICLAKRRSGIGGNQPGGEPMAVQREIEGEARGFDEIIFAFV